MLLPEADTMDMEMMLPPAGSRAQLPRNDAAGSERRLQKRPSQVWKRPAKGLLPKPSAEEPVKRLRCPASQASRAKPAKLTTESGCVITYFENEDASALQKKRAEWSEHLPRELVSARFRDDFCEWFSPPRLVPYLKDLGRAAEISIDVKTGFDLEKPGDLAMANRIVDARRPRVEFTCSPCAFFSNMMNINKHRMCPYKYKAKEVVGKNLLKVGMHRASEALKRGDAFVHEHPQTASSWNEEVVLAIAAHPSVGTVDFDQCMVGACTKVHKTPILKPTRLMTNIPEILDVFSQNSFKCPGNHVHQKLEGSEGGVQRCAHAAHYPPEMCMILVSCIDQHLASA